MVFMFGRGFDSRQLHPNSTNEPDKPVGFTFLDLTKRSIYGRLRYLM